MHVRQLTPLLGAEISGVELSAIGDDPDIVADIKAAFLAHHVLVFREQQLDREQHKSVGRLFGELHVHPSKRELGMKGDPEIFTVKTDANTVQNNGGQWHMDVSCEEVPPLGSMLLLKEAPPSGGDTVFANMHLAYDTLSPQVKKLLNGLTAFHDGLQNLRAYGYTPPPGVTYPANSHPVVVAHAETGRPLLFVNEGFTSHIEGVSARESSHLLRLLFEHIAGSPAIQCRVNWAPGTLVFWDNRCLQHFAVWDYAPHRRHGERVTVCATEAPRAAFPCEMTSD